MYHIKEVAADWFANVVALCVCVCVCVCACVCVCLPKDTNL